MIYFEVLIFLFDFISFIMYNTHMKKVTNKDISELTDKSVSTVAGWGTKQPKLLKVVELGAFCIKNNISIEFLETCTKFQEISSLLDAQKEPPPSK